MTYVNEINGGDCTVRACVENGWSNIHSI